MKQQEPHHKDKFKLGIIGGTFDPVHKGHIGLALDAKEKVPLDEVWFMPAKEQPFKLGVPITKAEDRIAMLELACEGLSGISVSTLEMELDGVSYTYRTLEEVRKRFAEKGRDIELFFIVGTDTFVKLEIWKEAEKLLTENAFVLAKRPGYDAAEALRIKKHYEETYGTKIVVIENEQIDISSTGIREAVHLHQGGSALVPPAVWDYIRRNRLYEGLTEGEIRDYVRGELPDKRWRHTQGVMESAMALAKRYGADEKKAELAALCHDMCKKWPEAQMDLFIREHEMDEKLIGHNNLAHGKVAAVVAKERLGIDDPDIINAISYHTTGRAGMSLLEKIVFLADSIEPARDFPEVERLRELAFEDIDKACLFSLERTRKSVLERGIELDSDTDGAIAWFRDVVAKKDAAEKAQGEM